MKKFLSGILITIGIAIYTTTILIFLEVPSGYRIVLLIGQYLMQIGIGILLFCEKEK